MASLLTTEEAVHYEEVQLGISDCNSLLQAQKYKLLCLLTRAMHEKVPFHNLCLMAQELKNRKKPDWKQIKEDMMSRIGGLCYTKYYFTLHLLQALGYEVKALLGHVRRPNNHYLLMVFNVRTEGDKHIVDVGFGYPQFEPVEMHFERESDVFVQSSVMVKFVKKGSRIARMQMDRSEKGSLEGFHECFDFTLDYYEPEELDHFFNKFYEIPKTTSFHDALCCMQYKDGKLRYIKNDKLKVEKDSGYLDEITLQSEQDMVEKITENFPVIPVAIARQAVANWIRLSEDV